MKMFAARVWVYNCNWFFKAIEAGDVNAPPTRFIRGYLKAKYILNIYRPSNNPRLTNEVPSEDI